MPDLRRPPSYRFSGRIIDAHCHFGSPGASDRMLRAGRLYGVARWVGICRVQDVPAYRKRWGRRAAFNVWTEHSQVDDASHFVRTNLRIVREAKRLGCHCIKFWYKPEYNERSGIFFDDPKLDPVFEAILEADLPALVHIADPDIWWQGRYRDRDRFETKQFTYRQLTNTLRRFPELRVIAAHVGGWPENLAFLDDLLTTFPNLFLDTSGTKWIARELSHRAADARAFMIRHADRLLFGSDLVAFKNATLEHYCSRYWVHRHLYEKDVAVHSPIHDPDAQGPAFVAGLDLPDAVLDKLYLVNASKLFFPKT